MKNEEFVQKMQFNSIFNDFFDNLEYSQKTAYAFVRLQKIQRIPLLEVFKILQEFDTNTYSVDQIIALLNHVATAPKVDNEML